MYKVAAICRTICVFSIVSAVCGLNNRIEFDNYKLYVENHVLYVWDSF